MQFLLRHGVRIIHIYAYINKYIYIVYIYCAIIIEADYRVTRKLIRIVIVRINREEINEHSNQ